MIQLSKEVESLDAILALHEWSKRHDITLLCFERSGQPCHRHLVREIVENPVLVGIRLEAEETNYHERSRIQDHIPNQETPLVTTVS